MFLESGPGRAQQPISRTRTMGNTTSHTNSLSFTPQQRPPIGCLLTLEERQCNCTGLQVTDSSETSRCQDDVIIHQVSVSQALCAERPYFARAEPFSCHTSQGMHQTTLLTTPTTHPGWCHEHHQLCAWPCHVTIDPLSCIHTTCQVS